MSDVTVCAAWCTYVAVSVDLLGIGRTLQHWQHNNNNTYLHYLSTQRPSGGTNLDLVGWMHQQGAFSLLHQPVKRNDSAHLLLQPGSSSCSICQQNTSCTCARARARVCVCVRVRALRCVRMCTEARIKDKPFQF